MRLKIAPGVLPFSACFLCRSWRNKHCYTKKPPQQAQYVAKETRLDHFFDALAGKLDVIIISSDAVKRRRSGTFDLSDPQAALSQMLKPWRWCHAENRTLYIYSSNEVESSMLTLNAVTRNELTTFLKQTRAV